VRSDHSNLLSYGRHIELVRGSDLGLAVPLINANPMVSASSGVNNAGYFGCVPPFGPRKMNETRPSSCGSISTVHPGIPALTSDKLNVVMRLLS
jgi:hypothetical protein